jgi:signal transduction histidine kinase
MTSRSRHTTKLHKARDKIAERGERITELERAFRRLQDLHDVSKLLTSFETAERTVPAVLSVVARTLALRNAVFLLGTTDTPLTLTWRAAGEPADALEPATASATSMLGYLLRAGSAVPKRAAGEHAFVMLPLVVEGSTFGALQVEGVATLDERDLVFLNAVVNQLAIAVDRAATITEQRVAIETEERQQHLLADLGAGLAAAAGSRDAFAVLARSMVPRIADVCFIDELRPDGTALRREASFAPEVRLVDRLQQGPIAAEVTAVLDTGTPVFVSDLGDREASGAELAEALRAADVTSMIIVPLLARGKTIGAMTLAVVSRRYSKRDLALAFEVAGHAGLGIDNIRLHEQTLHDADELRRAVRLREDVLAIVSHDLRNPLGVIDLSASALLGTHGDAPRSRQQLETIRRSVARMDHMIKDLLDMASIQTGRLELDRDPTDARKLVTEILDDLEPSMIEKGIELRRELDGLRLDADRLRIAQVFGNLLGNAQKFCGRGDEIRVRMTAVEDHALFVVEDTGPGIPEEELPHIFEPYWSARRNKQLGTGLGLYICKGIIDAHGGRLWVESKVGEGTRFFFTVPLA